jgi:hypothetical protein
MARAAALAFALLLGGCFFPDPGEVSFASDDDDAVADDDDTVVDDDDTVVDDDDTVADDDDTVVDDDDTVADDDDTVADDDDTVVDDDDTVVDDDDTVVDDDDSAVDDDDTAVDDDDTAPVDDDDIAVDDDDTAPVEETIYDVQDGTIPLGDLASIDGVIVTGVAINSSGDGYGLFVQEPAGGVHSGVWVYTDVGAEAFSVGDVVDVHGHVEEYDNLGLWTASVTELNVADFPLDSFVSGSGAPVAPPAPLAVSTALLSDPSLAEGYEGVLVQVGAVTVVDPDTGFGEWSVTDGVHVDDKIFEFGPVAPGDTFTSIAGVVDQTYDLHKLVPRSAADFGGYTQAVQPVESLQAGDLIVTEFMANPGLGCNDADDEYLEVQYVGPGAADLQGLGVAWGSNATILYAPLPVTQGDFLYFVREAPSPCYGHSGDGIIPFALTNSGAVVTLSTPQGTILDTLDTTGWGFVSGAAYGLNPATASAGANDLESNWCDQTTPLGVDFGTPGAPNDPC